MTCVLLTSCGHTMPLIPKLHRTAAACPSHRRPFFAALLSGTIGS